MRQQWLNDEVGRLKDLKTQRFLSARKYRNGHISVTGCNVFSLNEDFLCLVGDTHYLLTMDIVLTWVSFRPTWCRDKFFSFHVHFFLCLLARQTVWWRFVSVLVCGYICCNTFLVLPSDHIVPILHCSGTQPRSLAMKLCLPVYVTYFTRGSPQFNQRSKYSALQQHIRQ